MLVPSCATWLPGEPPQPDASNERAARAPAKTERQTERLNSDRSEAQLSKTELTRVRRGVSAHGIRGRVPRCLRENAFAVGADPDELNRDLELLLDELDVAPGGFRQIVAGACLLER